MKSNEHIVNSSESTSSAISKEKAMPDAFIILFFVVMLVAIATHFIPAGKFDVLQKGNETVLVADSFQFVEEAPKVTLFAENGEVGFFNFAFEGMVSGDRNGSAIGVMMFIILTGGAFGIIMQTGAIDNGVLALIKKTQRLEVIFIPLLFVLFSLAGAIFGMGEEAIAFCIVLLPLMIAIGYDGITTVLVTYVATQIGFAASWMNPFSVAIAQGIAGVPLMSGMEYRIAMWVVFTLIGLIFTMRYAASIKADPTLSPSYHTDRSHAEQAPTIKDSDFTYTDGIILLTFLLGIIWVIWGVLARQYYIPEIASQFFTLGCVVGVVSVFLKRLTVNQVAASFKKGAQELLPAAMIVGMAKGIVILMGGDDASTPSVLNTVLYYASQAIGDLPATLSATLMFVFQSIFNFFIASGSGQAALTMPLMAPLSDLVGVSRQVAVLAFQLGDGLTNIIIPTSAALIGCLGVAKVDWLVWARFISKFMMLIMTIAIAFIVTAVLINLN
jgi:uncharacterized ion transporter superfamily protein YfcC